MIENINYTRIEKAIQYLVENFKQQPTLDELAQYIGVSPFHFQRIFTEWAGISPKKFLEHLTIEALKQELQDTSNLIETFNTLNLYLIPNILFYLKKQFPNYTAKIRLFSNPTSGFMFYNILLEL